MKTDNKEAMEVTIKETSDEKSSIEEIYVNLNTLQGIEASASTPFISGKLESGIITSTKPVHIMIFLASNPNIIVYEKQDYVGSYYLPFRISAVSKSGNVFNFAPEQWCLNDALSIIIKGQKETSVDIVLRYTK